MSKTSLDDTEQIYLDAAAYIYRVQHRVMEGDCQVDHGPKFVEIPAISFDKYPVTNRRFKRFLDESGYWPDDGRNFLKHWQNDTYPEGLGDHPVVWVSQSDAKAFSAYYGCRLPKDTEWQWAACGKQKNHWPWGNAFSTDYCNADGGGTTPVYQYPQGTSPFGCMDMCGNTWEWIDELVDDGEHLFTLIRGGSFFKAPHMWHAEGGPQPTNFHLKFPLMNEALNRCETVGFRCVKELSKS